MILTATVSISLVFLISPISSTTGSLRPFTPPPLSSASSILSILKFYYYQWRFENRAPGRPTYARHNSKIGLVAIYCATLFWRRATYISISCSTCYAIASSRGEYVHVQSPFWCYIQPVSCRITQWWNPPINFLINGNMIHHSNP